jgi:hypothetical protein
MEKTRARIDMQWQDAILRGILIMEIADTNDS